MNILMLSLDRTLVGDVQATTDAIKRHRRYAEYVDTLQIIVLTREGYEVEQLARNLFVYPTNSTSRLKMVTDAFRIARGIHADRHIDVIVAQDFTAPIALKISKKINRPYIINFHAAEITPPSWIPRLMQKAWKILFKNSLRRALLIRVVSPEVKKVLVNEGIFEKRIRVIPTPVDLAFFSIQQTDKVEELKKQYPDGEYILFVGRLEQVKNIPLLFTAMQMAHSAHPQARLIIVGGGKKYEELKSLSKSMGISDIIIFAGRVAHKDIPAYYKLARVCVLSSDSESLGKVLIEAGMAKCPVVATKTTGAQFVVEHEKTGLLTPIGDSEKFAEAIIKLLKDTKYAKKLGESAPAILRKKFDMEENVRKMIGMWREAAEENHK